MSIGLLDRRSVKGYLPWAVLGLGTTLVIISMFIMLRARGLSTLAAAGSAEAATAAPSKSTLPSAVTLPAGKLKTAALAFEKAGYESLPSEFGVAGRIDVNQDRQAQMRPRASGVIREVKAALGQKVKKGQTLVVLDSPDVGTARLNLRAKQRELATARHEADWKKQINDNVAVLIPLLRKRAEARDIQKEFANRPLGSFRATLLSAYSKFDIAAHEEEKTASLRRDKILGEHPVYVAQHTREGTQAEFDGVVDTAVYESSQQSRVADQQVKLAESDVIDAAQRLRILGVSENVDQLLAKSELSSSDGLTVEDVTAYIITAPFDATIISKSANTVASQKVEINDVLLGLADLSTVWVTANIPESDFALLPELEKGKIRLGATAYRERMFEANLLSVGATVDPTTRTVAMLAETSNTEGLLKIGMFVRIVLDTADESKALAIPDSAVVEIEGKKGVFVPEGTDGHTFTFKTVILGRESGGRQVIASGLLEGEAVVSKGAFALKAELILQSEKDEE